MRPRFRCCCPPHYTTLYAVTLLTDEELKCAIAEKVLHPETTRAQLQKWHRELSRKVELATRPKEAARNSDAVSLPTDSETRRCRERRSSPTTSDDSPNDRDELAADPKYAPAPEAVAPAAEPLAPPPSDDIPAFLDRRPLSAEDQRAYDAIMAALNSASTVVRERVRAELIRESTSSRSPAD